MSLYQYPATFHDKWIVESIEFYNVTSCNVKKLNQEIQTNTSSQFREQDLIYLMADVATFRRYFRR